MKTALVLGVGFDKKVGIKFVEGFLIQVSVNAVTGTNEFFPYKLAISVLGSEN